MHSIETPHINPSHDVVLGGGSTAALSAGMAKAAPDRQITRVISMSDSGSVTGAYAEHFGTLPVGDIGKAVSLGAISPEVTYLSEKRFDRHATADTVKKRAHELLGALAVSNPLLNADRAAQALDNAVTLSFEAPRIHNASLRHILLTSLTLEHNNHIGNATDEMADMYMVSGRILPVTLQKHELVMNDSGNIVRGEANIDQYTPQFPDDVRMSLSPSVPINPEVDKALREAANVFIAPGSRNTSIMPILLTEGVPEAMQNSRLIIVGNAHPELHDGPGTEDVDGNHHVEAIEDQIKRTSDVVMFHEDGREDDTPRGRQRVVRFDRERLESNGRRTVVGGKLLVAATVERDINDAYAAYRSDVAHDPRAVIDTLKQYA